MRHFILINLLFFSSYSWGQYTLAGKSQTSGFFCYYNNITDITLKTCYNCSPKSNVIDINGDNINDYVVEVSGFSALGASFYGSKIFSLNNNQVAYFRDTCIGMFSQFVGTYLMACPFALGDTINNKLIWGKSGSGFYFAYNSFQAGSHSCNGNAFTDTSRPYIGLRAFVGTDTIYGWLHVDSISEVKCRLLEFGSCRLVQGIAEEKASTISIYPNPGTGIFNLNSSFKKGEFMIHNLLGEIVYSGGINSNTTPIDLSGQAIGTYILSIIKESGTQHQKIVLQRD